MSKHSTFEEMQERVRDSLAYYGGSLPRDAALAWDGYFAALIEWGLISPDQHARLLDMLPKEGFPKGNDDPVLHILLGWCDLTSINGPDAKTEINEV